MSPLLVDSAVYIQHLRAQTDVRQVLLPYLRAGNLYSCGVVRAEVLRGMKTPASRDGLEAFFNVVPEVPCDARLWRAVSQLGWQLGRKGKWPPVTDLVIAACAIRVGAAVVSPDAHFEDVPGLHVLESLPGEV
jgi:predicted nucleic acid-binding protein